MPEIKYFMTINEAGLPTGFYNTDVYPDIVEYGPTPPATEDDPTPAAPELSREPNPGIPAGAIEITEDQWHELVQNQGVRRWDKDAGAVVAYEPPPPPVTMPASVTLQEWRSALDLWMVDDPANAGQKISRLSQVYAAVKPIVDSGNPLGKVAMQQLEYANNVELSQLMRIKDAFGFSQSDCEESMWRGLDIRNGIYTGETPANMSKAA